MVRTPAARGAIWTVAGFGTTQIFRLISSLTLTRLLFPEAFGLMALTSSFIVGLELLSDAGIRQCIIRHERGEERRFLASAWTLQVIRGGILFACSVLIAFPVARIYGEPMLMYFIPAAGTALLVAGFRSPSIALAFRRLDYRAVTLLDLGSTVTGIFSTIVIAYFYPSTWALVAGSIIASVLSVTGSYLLFPKVGLRFELDRADVREIVSFGKWILGSSAMFFIASQADRLLLGQYLAIALLGSYSIADQLSRLPRMVADQIAGQVAFPVFSRTQRDSPASLRDSLARTQGWLDAFVFGAGFLAAVGAAVIGFMYDSRYADAGWMLQILAVRSGISCAARAASSCLVASGRPYYNTAEQFVNAVSLVLFSIAGWEFGGALGLVWGIALSELPAYLLLQFGLVRHRLFSAVSSLRTIFAGAVGFAAGAALL